VLSLYHSFFIIFSLILVMIIYFIIMATGKKGLSTSISESTSKYKIAFWLEEIARSKLSFKLTSDSDLNLRKTNGHVNNYLESRETHFRVIINQSLLLIAFKVLIAAGLLITGSILVFNEQMNIGQFVAAEIIIILIIASVEKMIKVLDSIYDVLTALEKIGYVFDKPLDSCDGLQLKDSRQNFSVSVENLSYKYDNAVSSALNDVTFDVPTDKSVIIKGPSSSGKSTLLKIMSGILDPDMGIVKYNGFPLGSLDLDNLKKDIGFCLNNGEIFHGTILENISMERIAANADNISKAIDITGLNEFLSAIPLGLKTIVDPEGNRIPRNIQNRILLARAIATQPKLLMLEDPLDHVNSLEKDNIISRLTDAKNPWTIIVTSVDEIWKNYIDDEIVLRNGIITSNTLNNS
ncbi:MAG: ATP-binding cassette domain-containing protein, partial [Bacteroidota bacterium]